MGIWQILDWAFLVVPLALGIMAVRLGATQVREFHRHTGDTGVIMSMAALSRFHDDPVAPQEAQTPELPMQLPKVQKSRSKPLIAAD